MEATAASLKAGRESTRLAVLVKAYPRLSETFISQELLELEKLGFDLTILAIVKPQAFMRHAIHSQIKARVIYLPESPISELFRTIAALRKCVSKPNFYKAIYRAVSDAFAERDVDHLRRLFQAVVAAAEFPQGVNSLYAHFAHSPSQVALYLSIIKNIPWACSAHAKDIWTTKPASLRRKLTKCAWVVTCTRAGQAELEKVIGGQRPVYLSYHGIDHSRFPPYDRTGTLNAGKDPGQPIVILSVGRAVEKKGYDVLFQALSRLPPGFSWEFRLVGGGGDLEELKQLVSELGIQAKVKWCGPMVQADVLKQYQDADIFVLASKIGRDGDRDGLPNVLVEAASQKLACISTTVSGIPEFITDDVTGVLVAPGDPAELAEALKRVIEDPELRMRLGEAASERVKSKFQARSNISIIATLLRSLTSNRETY